MAVRRRFSARGGGAELAERHHNMVFEEQRKNSKDASKIDGNGTSHVF